MRDVKLFRDRIHGFIEIPWDTLLPIVDTPEFQRLRRLTQLGTSSVTYPGAEHSRFQHCLGVAHLFQMLAAQFRAQTEGLSDEEDLIGKCAALLHDIGHGPFSHALEEVLTPKKSHERWTQEIVLDDSTGVHQRLRQLDAQLPREVAAVIGKRSKYRILTNMISSQLDVDRMDYLLRDADCVGVPYGSYDIARLIRMMHRRGAMIVVDRRGVMNVEQYIFARYHMYWQVYFHPTTRGYECLLKAAWRRAQALSKLGALKFEGVSPALRAAFGDEPLPLHQYLQLDNHDVYAALKAWRYTKDSILADLCRRLLDRDLLKSIDLEGHTALGREGQIRAVVEQRGFDPDYYALYDRPAEMPYDYYTWDEDEGTKPSILVYNPRGQPEEISRSSRAIAAIARERQVRVRLYVPQECREDVRRLLSQP